MKRIIPSLTAAAAIAIPSFAFAADWTVDPAHSSAQFEVEHLMISSVRGDFKKLSGEVTYDPKAPKATVINAVIDTASVHTRIEDRDKHLRSPDFFDVEKFPTMTFKSTSAKKKGKGLEVKGDLTLRGVTKPVVLDVVGLDKEVKDPWGNTRIGGLATTKINRKDYGMTFNQALETGGVMIGDEVTITIDVELIKKAAEDKTTAEK